MGNLLAPTKDAWKKCSGPWLYFLDVRGMTVHGSGVINGQGRDWWGKVRTLTCFIRREFLHNRTIFPITYYVSFLIGF